MELTSPVTDIRGVGDALGRKFKMLGLSSIEDLIYCYPRRYEDYSKISQVAHLHPGVVSIKAEIKQISGRYVRRGMHITEAIASDESGSVRIVWFNQPYRASAIKEGQPYYISGPFELRRQRFAINNPSIELVSEFSVNTARIVPIYHQTKGLNSRQIRSAIKECLPVIRQISESLPEWIVGKYSLMSLAEALEQVHFPDDNEKLKTARHRLGFEEVFELSLASQLNKREILSEKAAVVPFELEVAKKFVASLPFKLTDAQRKVVWQIYQDMQSEQPMNRLVEGDVGSGKTVVAAMASAMVLHQGKQVAIMAPTEILARQHGETFMDLLGPLGFGKDVVLLIGSMTKAQKAKAYESISTGRARFIVGTHALIQEAVDMKNLELIVIDEQHRFGVEQRKALMKKAKLMPHTLSLTATPIPRSLALVVYGELDVSILDTKPPGRKPVITKICSPNSRPQLYAEIKALLATGQQLFVVCPLIKNDSTPVVSVEEVYAKLSNQDFRDFRVGLLHGKLKPSEKSEIMQKFVDHKLDILVSTTVIEVGVDVPNASAMLIESADRFGLAQIHQLRGRVGRGNQQAYCYLMMSDSSPPTRRLRAVETTEDGFKLAELDLKMRGPGAIYGVEQHGQLDLRMADIGDLKLTLAARAAAEGFIEKGENLLQYKRLATRVNNLRTITNLN